MHGRFRVSGQGPSVGRSLHPATRGCCILAGPGQCPPMILPVPLFRRAAGFSPHPGRETPCAWHTTSPQSGIAWGLRLLLVCDTARAGSVLAQGFRSERVSHPGWARICHPLRAEVRPQPPSGPEVLTTRRGWRANGCARSPPAMAPGSRQALCKRTGRDRNRNSRRRPLLDIMRAMRYTSQRKVCPPLLAPHDYLGRFRLPSSYSHPPGGHAKTPALG